MRSFTPPVPFIARPPRETQFRICDILCAFTIQHRALSKLAAKMEKITDKINALPENAPYFSLEFFPPKTQMVCANTPLLRGHIELTAITGLLELAGTTRANGEGTAPSFRYRNVGSRR